MSFRITKQFVSFLAVGAGLGLAGCGQLPNASTQVSDKSVRLPNGDVNRRVHLLKFTTEGYEPYRTKFMSLDVGVLEKRTGDRVECELVTPRTQTRAAGLPWAPLDFYANLRNATERQAAGDRVGEANIFFAGDENNRNGGNDAATATVVPDPMMTNSMDFMDRRTSQTEISTFFRFVRTGILYQSLIRVKAKLVGGSCTAIAYVCNVGAVDATARTCAANGWRQFRKTIVTADVRGGLGDQFRTPASDRERNDVAALRLELSNIDADGNPTGAPYEETVARK